MNPQQFSEQIAEWIETAPHRDVINEYVKHIPDLYQPLIVVSAEDILDTLWQQKDEYMVKNNLSQFTKILGADEQIDYINKLSQFNGASVKKGIQKKYPEFTDSFPPDIYFWAYEFTKKWQASLLLLSCPEYIRLRVYAQSLIISIGSDEDLSSLISELTIVFTDGGKSQEAGTALSASEVEGQRALLKRLNFLPEDYIKKIITPVETLEKYNFINQLLTILTIIQVFGLQVAVNDQEQIMRNLWDHVALWKERDILIEKEGLLEASLPSSDVYLKVFEWLEKTWSVDNIQSRVAEKSMVQYLGGLQKQQRERFVNILQIFIEDSIVINSILEPNDPQEILSSLKKIKNPIELNTFIEEILVDVSPEIKKVSDVLIRSLFNIFEVSLVTTQ